MSSQSANEFYAVNTGTNEIIAYVNISPDPFEGSFLDVFCPASKLAQQGPAFAQSGATIGTDNNNQCCTPIGGGVLTFASSTPLIVQVIFNGNPNNATPLPTLQGTLAKFELEY